MSKDNKWDIANYEHYIIAFPLVLLLVVGYYQRIYDHYQLLDYDNNRNLRMLFGLTIGCAFILLVPILLAAGDFVLGTFLWVLFFFIPLAVLIWQVVIYYNCSHDITVAHTISAKVVWKDQSRSKSGTYYTLVMTNKSFDASALRVSVAKDFFENVKINDYVELKIRNGNLGFKWLESYKKGSE